VTHLGAYNTSGTRTHVRFQFSTHAGTGANVAPSSPIDAADIRIYRAGDSAAFSATERSSVAGITCVSPFDSLVGFHDIDINLADDTDGGFYAAGYTYSVVLAPDNETIDAQVITGIVLAMFEIGPPPVNVVQISGDATAADNLEEYLDGTHFMPVDPMKVKWSVTGTTLTVKEPDGTTTAYTRTLATLPDASADDIVGSS
jgi:hypothetical protein